MVTREVNERSRLRSVSAEDVRQLARDKQWTSHTVGLAAGFIQTNLVILPQSYAFDFLLFCTRNPKPCPVIDVTEPGSPVPRLAAPSADLRFDLPRYRVYEKGELVDEPTAIETWWRDDLVAFLLGCSYTFEDALEQAGVRLRHVQESKNVAMFRTDRACVSAGPFAGPLVVSMRPIHGADVARVVSITSRYPHAHGAPIWIGDPIGLGIASLGQPDWGDALLPESGEIPVFWACGVTPQAVAMQVRPSLMITHAPGHMFITDIPIEGAEMLGV